MLIYCLFYSSRPFENEDDFLVGTMSSEDECHKLVNKMRADPDHYPGSVMSGSTSFYASIWELDGQKAQQVGEVIIREADGEHTDDEE